MSFTSRFVTATDGLRLHVRDYGSVSNEQLVVCLPGVARTAADFDPLAEMLIDQDSKRRVLALDYRGRGLSDRDPDASHYDVGVESADILSVFAALGVERAVMVGTSRGGIHTMVLGAIRPDLIAGAVLNDIGPVLEAVGLERIKGYIGKLPTPMSWAEAVSILKGVAGAQFTGLSDAEWLHYAETTYEAGPDGFVVRYDPALMRNFAALDPARLPTMWDQFDTLAAIPLLLIRGENSDLLSVETLAAMVARHPGCDSLTVPGQGHAPLLIDPPTMTGIERFVARCEAEAPSRA